MNESRHLLHRGSAFSSTLPSLFGGCDEDDLASMTEEIALSDGYDVAVFVQNDLPNVAFPIIDDLRKRHILCDVIVNVADAKFKAHKVVLAAAIPYFHAMFTSNMSETGQSEITVGGGVDPSSMEALINFAYSGRVSISTNNVQSLMLGSSYLQLTRVQLACAEFLRSRLSPNNVLGVRCFAETLGCGTLVIACDKFVKKNFTEVADSEEFINLLPVEVEELLSDDELEVTSEEIVFSSVMKWIKHDPEDRCKFLPQLLAKVRLPLLTPQFLSDRVAAEELVRSSHKCRDLLDEARDFHLMPERRSLIQSFRTKPRRCNDVAGIIFAVGGQNKSGNSLSTVEVYDPVLGRWRDAEAMSMLRSRVGVAVMKNRLYAIGGYNGSERLNNVEVFDAVSKQWSKVAPMNCKRSAVGAVAIGDQLYVCGGFDGISSLDTVEKFDPLTNSWSFVPSMTKNRSAAGVCQLFGKIYVLGGHNGLSIFESVECYDTNTCRWEECKAMLSKRCRLGVASLAGKIYACGGYDGSSFLRSVEVFDPVENKWSYVAPMNVTRSRVALVSNMGRLWAIGGYDGMKNLSTVEVYNPETNIWSFVAPMESHEGGVGVGVIPNE